jgi:hypothetical protein
MVFFVGIGREIGFVWEVGFWGIRAKELEAECKAWVRPQIRATTVCNAGSMALGLRRREAWLFRGDVHWGIVVTLDLDR